MKINIKNIGKIKHADMNISCYRKKYDGAVPEGDVG